jgi:hypothetical protein
VTLHHQNRHKTKKTDAAVEIKLNQTMQVQLLQFQLNLPGQVFLLQLLGPQLVVSGWPNHHKATQTMSARTTVRHKQTSTAGASMIAHGRFCSTSLSTVKMSSLSQSRLDMRSCLIDGSAPPIHS